MKWYKNLTNRTIGTIGLMALPLIISCADVKVHHTHYQIQPRAAAASGKFVGVVYEKDDIERANDAFRNRNNADYVDILTTTKGFRFSSDRDANDAVRLIVHEARDGDSEPITISGHENAYSFEPYSLRVEGTDFDVSDPQDALSF